MTLGDLFIEGSGIFATFYDKNYQPMGQYSVWERFVHYDNSATGTTGHSNDVIWKIQPPDGAKYVNFHQGWDGTAKSTGTFELTKGSLYEKSGSAGSMPALPLGASYRFFAPRLGGQTLYSTQRIASRSALPRS